MGTIAQLIMEKTKKVREDLFQVDGDLDRIQISASPIRKHEISDMIAQGKGLRIIVGSGSMKDMLVVWVGDSDSNIGAMHDTIASQFIMSMHDEPHVPLEMTRDGVLRLTTTARAQFDDPREVEDVLDRNREFRKIFGNSHIDMSKLQEAETLQPPEIEVGDEVRVGKFKNRKAIVKGFKTDKHNHPVLKTTKGDQQLFKPRLSKLLPE